MIIEFATLPGSGKSYLSEQLRSYLNRNLDMKRYKVLTRQDLVQLKSIQYSDRKRSKLHTLKVLLKIMNISLIRQLVRLMTLTDDFKNNRRYLKYYLRTLTNYAYLAEIKDISERIPVIIMDEGFLQNSTLFLSESKPKEVLNRYFNEVKQFDYINYETYPVFNLYIESCWQTNVERLNQRPKGWPATLKSLDSAEKREAMKKRSRLYNNLKDYCLKDDNHSTVINNSDFSLTDTTESFEKILQAVKSVH